MSQFNRSLATLLLSISPIIAQEKLTDSKSPETKPMPAPVQQTGWNTPSSIAGELQSLLADPSRVPESGKKQICCLVELIQIPESSFSKLSSGLSFQSSNSKQSPKVTQTEGTDGYIRVGINFDTTTSEKETRRVLFATTEEIQKFTNKCQEDASISILQAPRLTMFEGQTGRIQSVEQRSFITDFKVDENSEEPKLLPKIERVNLGLQIALTGKSSADGKLVRLKFDLEQSRLDSDNVATKPITLQFSPTLPNGSKGQPISFEQTVQIPSIQRLSYNSELTFANQQSAIIHLGTLPHTTRQEVTPTTVAKIPYLNRLFKNVVYGKENYHYIAVLTPNLIKLPEDVPPSPKTVPVKIHDETQLHQLLKAYATACADGATDDARRLAIECLAIDPTCFSKK